MNQNLENLEYVFEKLIETTQTLEKSHALLKDKIALLETKLENNRKYLENILNSITNGVCTIDTQFNITLLNPAGQKILNCANYSNLKIKDLFKLQFNTLSECLDYFNAKEVHELTIDDKKIKLKVNASLVFDKKEIIGAALVFEDITKIESLKLENKQKEKLATLGQMAASIAHDVRNPLASIQLFTSLIRESNVQNPQEIIKNININIQRIDEIVTNTLLIAKKIVVKSESLEIGYLINQIEKELANKLSAFNVLFLKKIEPITVISDRNLLKSIIVNLLSNAIEAANTSIELFIKIYRNYLIIIVKDDGPGLKDKNMVFQPFFSEKDTGIGLGLFIVKKAVEALNAEIKVLSFKKTIFVVRVKIDI